jgi:hypothetical protein
MTQGVALGWNISPPLGAAAGKGYAIVAGIKRRWSRISSSTPGCAGLDDLRPGVGLKMFLSILTPFQGSYSCTVPMTPGRCPGLEYFAPLGLLQERATPIVAGIKRRWSRTSR